MNIVNIVSSPKGGGAQLLVRELHKIYLDKNLEAHALYFNGSARNLNENETILGVNPRSPLNILRIRKVIKKLSNKTSNDIIVHAHLTWPFFYATLGCMGLSKIKLIYTEHNTTNKRRNVPLLWLLERLFYGRFTRIICISQGVNDALSVWVGSKIAQRLVTVPNGSRIYSMAERTALEGRLPRLVSIGSLTPKKNFATAISAIAKLKNKVDSYTIIGEGPERQRLEQLIESEQLEEKVKLVGWSDAIEDYLHAADIQLIPSLWEGFGLVAVEGMSTGLPVVASNVDGLREVVDESNPSVTMVNQVKSVDDWTASIEKALDELRALGVETLAHSARQQAEKFTLDKMAKQYINVYRRI